MYVCMSVIMLLDIGIWNLHVFIDIFHSFLFFLFFMKGTSLK